MGAQCMPGKLQTLCGCFQAGFEAAGLEHLEGAVLTRQLLDPHLEILHTFCMLLSSLHTALQRLAALLHLQCRGGRITLCGTLAPSLAPVSLSLCYVVVHSVLSMAIGLAVPS